MSSFADIERNVERLTGLTITQVRDMDPLELRAHIENRSGVKTDYTSGHPVIGRGNVLRDSLIASEELNREVDAILEREGV